ncbi:MAG: HDOD domain-containing protein [Ignavibacteriales bacterium]|nr:HDOD domain-containing protein [Ignavibacteriales bacterium]MCB9209374.1 HDOD domain-containing protein [Ignavibacteriales bacterium]
MEEQIYLERRKKSELALSNVYNLPAMSATMLEVSKLLDDPTTNTASLSKIIGKDQGLSTKILSIANSPLYGLTRKVSTIDFAILIIGYQDIKNIVVALTMVDSFRNKSDQYFDQNSFWMHSMLCGTACKRVAEDLGFRIGSEAFVAGLLHDLGIPVMHKFFKNEFEEIVKEFSEVEGNILDVERKHLGLDHQEIGNFLTNKWSLPEHLSTAILNHHKPSEAPEKDVLTALVHLVDFMTQKLEVGGYSLDKGIEFDEGVLEILGIASMEELDAFIESYRELFTNELNSDLFS